MALSDKALFKSDAMAEKLLAKRPGPVGFLARELLDEIAGLLQPVGNPAWA